MSQFRWSVCIRVQCTLLCAALFAFAAAQSAQAQPQFDTFRGGTIQWELTGVDTVDFTVAMAFRRSGMVNRCANPVTGGPGVCSGADLLPLVGDVVSPTVEIGGSFGFPSIDFGDGSTSAILFFIVTGVDVVNDWIEGLGVEFVPPGPLVIDTTIAHSYRSIGAHTATIAAGTRIPNEGVGGISNHINNPLGGFRIWAEVVTGTSPINSGPISTQPFLQECPIGAVCTFPVPAIDPEGLALSYQMATAAEAGDPAFVQPGPPSAPNAAAINGGTGQYTWDTTGAQLGAPGSNTLYSTQVVVTDSEGQTAVADFLIQLVPGRSLAPVITPGLPAACGVTLSVDAGRLVSFDVTASDPDVGDTVTLFTGRMPAEATMSPALPVTGNPVTSTFSWTPGSRDGGLTSLTFEAVDSNGVSARRCTVFINVNVPKFIEVPVDILPATCPNPIRAMGKGLLPVAITGMVDFDATQVDPSTLRLAKVLAVRTAVEDVASPFLPITGKKDPLDCTTDGPDGLLDVTAMFNMEDIQAALRTSRLADGDVVLLRLTGKTFGDIPIRGEDIGVILKRGRPGS